MSVHALPPRDLDRPRETPAAGRRAPAGATRRIGVIWGPRRHRLAKMGFCLIVSLMTMAAIGPTLVPYAYDEQNALETNKPPSAQHWFGTDDFGRDVFARTWIGARISLFVGITAALLDLAIGVVYGGVSGHAGGMTDELMMRAVEMLYAVPHLLTTILLVVVLGSGLVSIVLAMGLSGWLGMARLVRGQVLQLREREFVQASVAAGARSPRILFRHIIPNATGPILVNVTLTVPAAIFAEATLSFLGMGVPLPLASWGTMTAEATVTILSGEIWRLAFPAFFISLTMFAFTAVADGLRDALDPRLSAARREP